MKKKKSFARSGCRAFILSLTFLACFVSAQAQSIAVQYTTTQDWGSGFQGEIKITNNGTQAVNGWTLAFDFSRNINSIFSANIVSHVGNRYTVTNQSFNAAIPAGGNVTFGFTGSPGNVTVANYPSNYFFNGASLSLTASTFTYQGRLSNGSAAANGAFDLQFALYDEAGAQIGATVTREDVAVANGVFTAQLDFGANAFSGTNRLLEIRVRPGAESGAFTALSPRQPITAAPYAVRALNATNADNAANATTATNAQQLGGVAANNFAQTNSTQFVRNQTTQQTSTNFNISGTGAANILNAATQFNLGGSRIVGNAGERNLFVGIETGTVNTGYLNSFFGARAGRANTTGIQNSFFGADAGIVNTEGRSNSFFGESAGYVNTRGNDNSFFGAGAGFASTEGNDNSFFGRSSGLNNTVGSRNLFSGRSSGYLNSEGTGNTFLGYSAGFNNTVGSNNTLIGSDANMIGNNLNYAAAFGANAVVSTSDTIVLGKPAGNFNNVARPADTVQIPGSLVVSGTIAGGCRSGFTAFVNGRLCVSAMQSAATFWNAVTVCKNISARVGGSADVMLTFSDSNFNYFGGLPSGWLADHMGNDTWGTWNVSSPNSNFDGSPLTVSGAAPFALPFRCVY